MTLAIVSSATDPVAAPARSWAERLELFPLVVERLAGFDAGILLGGGEALTDTAPQPVAADQRAATCDLVASAIRAAFDADTANDARCLLKLKRAVHNGFARADNPAIALLPVEAARAVLKVISSDRCVADHAARSNALLSDRAAAMDRRLDGFGARADVRAAITLSGAERERLLRVARSDGRPVKPGEQRRSRLALLQFASRASCKTTPFSYFGATALVAIGAAGPGDVPAPRLHAQFTLDAALVQRLVWTALLHCDGLRATLSVQVNPALVRDGTALTWVAAPVDLSARESWGGMPAALRIDADAALAALIDAALVAPATRLGDLPGSAALGRQLLQFRLLEPVSLPGAQEPMLGWLADRIAAAPQSLAIGPPVGALAALERAMLEGDGNDVAARLDAARAAVSNFYAALDLAQPRESRPPLYHAAIDVSPRIAAARGPLMALKRDIVALADLSRLCSRSLAQQSLLADAFVAEHGVHGNVDAASFFAQHAARLIAVDEDGHAANFEALLRRHRPDPDGVLRLPPDAVAGAVAALPDGQRARTVAIGVQAQWIERDGAPTLVVNRTLPGGLRLSARYLRDDQTQIALARDYISHAHPCAVPAALPATVGVSGALHPRVLHHEIAVAGIDRDRSDAAPIALVTLRARYDARIDRVVLIDGDGRQVAPVLLGAVNPWLLPPVVRLLAESAAVSAMPIYATLWRAMDVAVDRPDRAALAMIPEVRVGRIVIARETMVYPIEALPAERDSRLFQRAMLNWLAARGLPAQLFVRFPAGPLLARLRGQTAHGGAERGHVKAKPAWFDFGEPAFAELFQQVLRARPPLVSLQACAPDIVPGRITREIQFEAIAGAAA